jgi:hypothetical protein
MSDQPKPATVATGVEIPIPVTFPKPTGEWTAATVSKLIDEVSLRGVADAHNASLAAKDEQHAAATKSAAKALAENHKAALTAEVDQGMKFWRRQEERHKEQLTAEREKAAELVDNETRRCHANWAKARDEAVAAAQQPLVDALTKSRKIHESMRPDLPMLTLLKLSLEYQKVVEEALAKAEPRFTRVKEGK